MRNFSSLSKNNIKELAIGKFDGVHLGHQKLLQELKIDCGVLMITQNNSSYLCDFLLQKTLIKQEVFILPLEEIKDWSGDRFIVFLKQEFPKLNKIVVGYDFCFGKNRQSTHKDLEKIFDGCVVVVPEVKIRGISVHTQKIKDFLWSGNIEASNQLLGRNYQIKGSVIIGQGIGSKKLYPTFNLQVNGFVIPKEGVYAGYVQGQEKELIGCAIFIGKRSTDLEFSIEVHLLESFQNFTQMHLQFVARIRDIIHFNDLCKLKKQITQDLIMIRKLLGLNF